MSPSSMEASAAAPSALVMSEENCTDIYGNVSVAVETDNVTCLGHAPEITNEVRQKDMQCICDLNFVR